MSAAESAPRAGTARPTVVVASVRGRKTFPDHQAARLEGVADVTFLERDGAMSTGEALAAFGDAEVVAVTPKVTPTIDTTLLEGLPRLRALSLYATGYDFIDVPELTRRGITLSVLPDYSTISVAEHAIGLILTLSRRIHLGNDRSRGLVHAATSLRGFELAGKTLGIIGCGRIGGRVATLAQAFGMQVVAYDIDPKPAPGVTYVDLAELLESSHVVAVHCPMVFGAPAMLGAGELALMRSGSALVNASRAELVDAAAVVEAVRSGHLRGYAVDDEVFSGAGVADLLTEGRIVQTGHSAWWSDEVLDRGGLMWAEHIHALIAGTPIDVVRVVPVDGDATRAQVT